jgi:hypothetical protein
MTKTTIISGLLCCMPIISKLKKLHIEFLANQYHSTTLCLLHRAHMPPAGSPKANNAATEEAAYPSRNIAYQAAGMITSIVENLCNHNEIRYTPAFM